MAGPNEKSSFLPRGTGIALAKAALVPFPDEPLELERPRADGSVVFRWAGLPGYQVIGRVRRRPDGLGIVGVDIRATDRTVSTGTLRDIPLGHLLQVVQARLGHLVADDKARRLLGATPRSRSEMALAEAASVRSSSRLGDDHYRRVAELLLNELTKGPDRGVHERLARRLTRELGRPVTRDTARDWVRIARKQGWLAPTKQGRPGAGKGPRLIEEEGSKP